MYMKKKAAAIGVICISMLFSSCGSSAVKLYTEEELVSKYGLGIEFPTIEADSDYIDAFIPEGIKNGGIRMRVYGSMKVYESPSYDNVKSTLHDGDIVIIKEITGSEWAEVYDYSDLFLGYTKNSFLHATGENEEMYAELPIEYGMAKTNNNTYVPAYSHLVDVRKYFKVYSSTEDLKGKADFSEYDLVVAMKLSTSDTSIGEPFYHLNLAMVQYDIIPMIKKAVELFRKDGYTMVICDAYRPTSVQQRWFDVVKVHKWVANPSIGMGGIHDRGTALDITLIDKDGNELEFPTPMHTFTEESARNSKKMTDTARANMNYMKDIMVKCGFTYINSEWWHFQDKDTVHYLPVDHPIGSIPLVSSEKTQVGSIPEG